MLQPPAVENSGAKKFAVNADRPRETAWQPRGEEKLLVDDDQPGLCRLHDGLGAAGDTKL
jgi:hypothetical protein